jgi:hypothetical protein
MTTAPKMTARLAGFTMPAPGNFQPGDTRVNAGTDNPLVAAHAVRNANGDLSVMLINKDPANSYQVNLDYAGFTPAAGAPTVYSYGDEASGITTAAQGSAASQVLPPCSIETVVPRPGPIRRPPRSPSTAPCAQPRIRPDRPGRLMIFRGLGPA